MLEIAMSPERLPTSYLTEKPTSNVVNSFKGYPSDNLGDHEENVMPPAVEFPPVPAVHEFTGLNGAIARHTEAAVANQIDNTAQPARKNIYPLGPLVKRVIRCESPEEIIETINSAIDTENERRAADGMHPLTTSPQPRIDSETNRIRQNATIAAVIIDRYYGTSLSINRIVEDVQKPHVFKPEYGPEVNVLFGEVTPEYIEAVTSRLRDTGTDFATAEVIAISPTRNLPSRLCGVTYHGEQTYGHDIELTDVTAQIMSSIFRAGIIGLQNSPPDSQSPQYQAMRQYLNQSRHVGIQPVSILMGGFNVGTDIYAKLFDLAQNISTATDPKSIETCKSNAAAELAKMWHIPSAIAMNHLQPFLLAFRSILHGLDSKNSGQDAILIKDRKKGNKYRLNPDSVPMIITANLDDGSLMTGCPAIIHGIITDAFKNYADLRLSIEAAQRSYNSLE